MRIVEVLQEVTAESRSSTALRVESLLGPSRTRLVELLERRLLSSVREGRDLLVEALARECTVEVIRELLHVAVH